MSSTADRAYLDHLLHPEVPWDALAGFRNRIVHAYMDVDPALIWGFIESDLDALRQLAEKELGADQ